MFREIRAKVQDVKERPEGTYFLVLVPNEYLVDQMRKHTDNGILTGELRIDDSRRVTSKQRRKYWATIRDISWWNFDDAEENHFWLKYMYCTAKGIDSFSMSDCSVSLARDYITFILDFCLAWDVPLSQPLLGRTDDINTMLYLALQHEKCVLCGRKGEQHHWDAIGMGHDRRTFDDSEHRKISLCREHHTEAHKRGRDSFAKKYHVYGIIYND